MSFRYDVINRRTGEQEAFTGKFKTKEEALKWERKHLDFWIKEGIKPFMVIAGDDL